MKTLYQYKPLRFFCVTFLATWSLWFFAGFIQGREGGNDLFIIPLLLGLMAPFVTALWMIATSGSKELKRSFFRKLIDIRLIKIGSIPPILLIPPVSIVASIGLSMLFGYSSDQFTVSSSFSFSIGSVPTLLVLFMAASFEELGWRGYAMESISSQYNYFNATAIFAVLWAMWHAPLFLIQHTYQNDILNLNPLYAVNFMVSIIPLAFIISWLCRKNSSSIIAAVFLHFVVNISQEFFMVAHATKCLQTLVLVVIAAVIVLLNREMFFDEPKNQPIHND